MKVTKKMTVPPTSRMLKTMQRMRSKTAAANFQSSFFSLSGSSAVLLRIFALLRSSNSIRSLSVVPAEVMSCSCGRSYWKSPASLLSILLPAGDGVGVFADSRTRSQGASFCSTSHLTCSSHPQAKLSGEASTFYRIIVIKN